MSRTVFILGAGASRETGAPLMGDFLDKAEELWRSGIMRDVENHFKAVFDSRGAMQSILSKSQLNIYNIETLYATLEMAKILNVNPINFHDRNDGGSRIIEDIIDNRVKSMKILIVKTLEHSIRFPAKGGTDLEIQLPFESFEHLISKLESRGQDCSIITFNYDVNLDIAFHRVGRLVDYGLDMKYGKNMNAFPLLKLHGSLHWGWCKKCERIVPMSFQKHLGRILRDTIGKYQKILSEGETIVPVGSEIKRVECDQCKREKRNPTEEIDETPVIVPPTWNKTDYHLQVSSVWNRAANELSTAENIFVIGYSFPFNDYFFHYLYALGSLGKYPLKRFWIFDPKKEEVEERFRKLIGNGVQSFKVFPNYFSEASQIIEDVFENEAAPEKASEKMIKRRTQELPFFEKILDRRRR